MEDTTKVLELLDELEDYIENATTVPITGRILADSEELFSIVRDIRLSLPDDIQQAQWIREERDRILADAKAEYERIVKEAQKQAEYLVETDEITKLATKKANDMIQEAKVNSRMLKMKSYDYVDKMLYDMQGKMDELNMKYFGEMYTNLADTFQRITEILDGNRNEIKQLAYKTQSEADEER